MPKKGWSSISIKDFLYNELILEYKKQENELQRKGITSFSGYIAEILYGNLPVPQKREREREN